jgi:isopropylmalate/homocitrate/citramalate synthase
MSRAPVRPQALGSSSRYFILHALKRLGLEATEAQVDAALAKVKELSTRHRRAISDEEFKKILTAVKPA